MSSMIVCFNIYCIYKEITSQAPIKRTPYTPDASHEGYNFLSNVGKFDELDNNIFIKIQYTEQLEKEFNNPDNETRVLL